MIAATLFSGIGAPECAMPHWRWAWCAEIEKFPSAVMAARHPESVNLGDVNAHDFCKRALAIARPDVVVFGSPCQDFSVAGKRLGMDGARGNLTLIALGILARIKPRWFAFENVPGLLSAWSGAEECPSEPGSRLETVENSDFAAFLGAVSELGYSLSWASLDAQYRGLAQRRDRLFAVGYLGDDWRPSAAVLFEPEGLCGNSPPSRETGQGIAAAAGGGPDGGRIAGAVSAKWVKGTGGPAGDEAYNLVAATLQANDGWLSQKDGIEGRVIPILEAGARTGKSTDRGTRILQEPIAFSCKDHGADASDDISPTLRAMEHESGNANGGGQVAVAFKPSHFTRDKDGAPDDVFPPLSADADKGDQDAVVFDLRNAAQGDVAQTLQAAGLGLERGGNPNAIPHTLHGAAVRRLTPKECERLQGFADDYTLITYRGKRVTDSPRYRALGNSMAVPVIRLILERIEAVDALLQERRAA